MRAFSSNGLWSFILCPDRHGCGFKQKSMMATDLPRRPAASSVHLWPASNHLSTIVCAVQSSSAASRPSCSPARLDSSQNYSMASSGIHSTDPHQTTTSKAARHLTDSDQDRVHSAPKDRTTANRFQHHSTSSSCLPSSRLTSSSRPAIQTKPHTKQDDLCTLWQQCGDVYRSHSLSSSSVATSRMAVPLAPDIWSGIARSMSRLVTLVICFLLLSLCNAQSTLQAHPYKPAMDEIFEPSETFKSNLSFTRINHRVLCSDPPLVPHALSHLKRNQKHYVFVVGTEAVYMCEQGYKAVNGTNISKCLVPDQLHPNLSPLESSEHQALKSVALLTSGRSKNSKRLMNNFDEEEHDLNGNVGSHSPSFFFPTDKRKMSRKTDGDLGPQYDSHEYDGRTPSFDGLEIAKPKSDRPIWSSNTAKWTPVTLNCQPVTCPDPGEVDHAIRHTNVTTPGVFHFNSNVHYQCDNDYDTIGFPIVVCSHDGTWNRAPPSCRLRQCPPLPELEGGKIIYSDSERRVDSRATYQCDPGYQLKNVPVGTHLVRHCGRNEEWTPFEPPILLPNATAAPEPYRCVQVVCPPPQRPHPGLRILSKKVQKYLPDSLIIYSCLTNKNRVSAKCLASGEWSRGPPHCPADSFCHPITTLPNGTVKIEANRANFACNEGFNLVGWQTLTCNVSTGHWNAAIPVCEPTVMPSGMPSFSTAHPRDEPLENLHQSTSKTLTIMITVIGVVVGVLVIAIGALFCRWRKQKLQRKKWQQYFGHYHHRQSRTHIVMPNNYGGQHNGTSQPAISAAGSATAAASKHLLQRSRANSKSGAAPTAGYLQSSFSSADENGLEVKSFNTGTISSEHARTISTYADDTCPEDDDYDDDDEDSSNNSSRMLRAGDQLPTPSSISSSSMAPARQHNSLPPSVTASLLVTFPGNEAAKRTLSTGTDHHIYSNVPHGGAIPLSPITTTHHHADNRLVDGVPVTDL